jgi:hypothetical protein
VYRALKARRDVSRDLSPGLEFKSQKSEVKHPAESEGDLDQ